MYVHVSENNTSEFKKMQEKTIQSKFHYIYANNMGLNFEANWIGRERHKHKTGVTLTEVKNQVTTKTKHSKDGVPPWLIPVMEIFHSPSFMRLHSVFSQVTSLVEMTLKPAHAVSEARCWGVASTSSWVLFLWFDEAWVDKLQRWSRSCTKPERTRHGSSSLKQQEKNYKLETWKKKTTLWKWIEFHSKKFSTVCTDKIKALPLRVLTCMYMYVYTVRSSTPKS